MKRIIFTAFTPYHLLTSMYYATKLKGFGGYERVLIWHDYADYNINFLKIEKFFDHIYKMSGYCNNKLKKQIEKCKKTGRGFKYTEIGRYVRNCKEGSILICFSDVHELSNKLICEFADRKNKIILVEEGIGIYRSDHLKLPMRSKIINKLLGIGTENVIGSNGNILAVILKHPEWIKKNKFQGVPLVQQNDIFVDEEFLERLTFIKEKIKYGNTEKKVVLWLGDPVEDIGGNKMEEINTIVNVSKLLGERYLILIKAHPREKKETYKHIENSNIKLFDVEGLAWVPIELMVKFLEFRTIITSVSSAAFNIYKSGGNVQVIYLYNILQSLKFDRRVMEPIIAENDIYCPENLKDVIEIINGEDFIKKREIQTVNEDEDIDFLISLLGDEKNERQ